MVGLQYEGTSLDDALERLAQRVGLTLPGASCGAWDWKAKVDDAKIRALIEQ
jgi:hypothetical protein